MAQARLAPSSEASRPARGPNSGPILAGHLSPAGQPHFQISITPTHGPPFKGHPGSSALEQGPGVPIPPNNPPGDLRSMWVAPSQPSSSGLQGSRKPRVHPFKTWNTLGASPTHLYEPSSPTPSFAHISTPTPTHGSDAPFVGFSRK